MLIVTSGSWLDMWGFWMVVVVAAREVAREDLPGEGEVPGVPGVPGMCCCGEGPIAVLMCDKDEGG